MNKLRIKIPKISRKEFISKLKNKKYENIEVINYVEKYLLKKRGYVFQMPPKSSPVILLLSGGLDSTIVWAIFLKIYKYQVYPVFFHRVEGRHKKEWASVQYFYNILKKDEPRNCIKPINLSVTLPPKELEYDDQNAKDIHGMTILDTLDLNTFTSPLISTGVLPYTYPFLGTAYSRYLFYKFNIKIFHIFSSVTPDDGDLIPSQSFTALRSTMLDMCIATADYSWQFASYLYEKEIGHYLEKWKLIQIGNKLNLPLEKTWSCIYNRKFQCGNRCISCYNRKTGFKKARINDKTIYLDNWRFNKISNIINSLLTKIKMF